MRPLAVVPLFAASLWAQSTPILTQPEIQELETKVASSPTDLPSQALLGKSYALFILGVTSLGQYDTVTGVDPNRATSDFAAHARDVIQTSTLPTVLGEGAEALWNFSFQVQGLAVRAPSLHLDYLGARALGPPALDRAIGIDPANPTWRYYRIPITVLRSNYLDFMPLTAADAYSLVKEDLAVLTGSLRYAVLAYGAKLAVNASALDDARAYASELLNSATNPQDWNYGNALFFGNMVLGQVALRRGDTNGAVSFLIASGKTPGSPQLDSFGPNMSLVKDLLTGVPSAPALPPQPHSPRHRAASPLRHSASPDVRQSVLNFFDLCRVFWTLDSGRLDQWSQQVRSGLVPDFGANLYY
jgi:hypothetical protein